MDDIERITVAVERMLDERRSVSEEQHREDHEFIQILKAREARKSELANAVKLHVVKWGTVGLLTGICVAVWMWIKQQVSL